MHSVNVLWRLKHPLTMSVAERESEILKFETQEREDKHETMRILNIPYSYGTENELFYLLENAQFSSRIEQFSTIP